MITRTIFILEDDRVQRKHLQKWMEEYGIQRNISLQIVSASSVVDAKKVILAHPKIFAFFLDISLKEGTEDEGGLEFSRYLHSIPAYRSTPILYVTSYADHMADALNTFHCFAFLLKPYDRETLFAQLDDLADSYIGRLYVRDPEGIYHTISLNQIIYVRSEGRYLHYVTADDEIRSRQFSMAELLQKLPAHFVRCHKSYIINTEKSKNYDFTNRYAELEGTAEHIPISRAIKSKDYFHKK